MSAAAAAPAVTLTQLGCIAVPDKKALVCSANESAKINIKGGRTSVVGNTTNVTDFKSFTFDPFGAG